MKKHKILLKIIVLLHLFITAVALLLIVASINASIGMHWNWHRIMTKIIQEWPWSGGVIYLFVVAIVAFVSGICLLVKKRWGYILTLILASLLLILGSFLFYSNIQDLPGDSIIEYIRWYFILMGASLSYIDLFCIVYGIFVIIYFTRKTARNYLTQPSSTTSQYSD